MFFGILTQPYTPPVRHMPLECDINIAVNGCSGFATSTQKGPFMAMLLSRSRGTYLIRNSIPSWLDCRPFQCKEQHIVNLVLVRALGVRAGF